MEGISDLEEYIDDAEKKDIHGIAITDTNSTQAILEMNETLRQKIGKTNIRIVFGTEITIIDRKQTNAVIFGEREEKDKNKREKKLISEQEFIAIDIETTGLAVSSDKIIEFGYCIFSEELENKKKKINFKIKKSGSFLIHHPELIENKARHINRITYSELLSKGITHQEALQKINELLKDRVVVVFNQNFDLTFLQRDNLILGSKFPSSPVIDLMVLANIILKRRISLKSVSKTLLKKVFEEEKHHRAQYDAELLPKIFEKLLQRLILISKKEIRNLEQIKKESHKISASNPNLKLPRDQKYQVILLSKNKKGISEINKVLSQCNFNRIKYKIAALTEEELQVICETNPNFLIGSSACSEKMLDLVEAFKNNPNNKQNRFILKQKIALFDFLEVAPPSNTR